MNDEDKTVKITLSGKITFDEDITVNQAAQIIAFVGSASQAPVQILTGRPTAIPTQIGSSKRFETPRSAISTTNAKTYPEKIVALAGYVLQEGSRDSFTAEDVRPLFRRAGEVTPSNMKRDLTVAVQLEYIAETDQKGEYYLASKGTDALDEGFKANNGTGGGQKTAKSSNGKKRSTRNTKPLETLKNVNISTTVSGYPSFHSVAAKTDKLLWVLMFAKSQGLESLSSKEISQLSDRLGDGIPANNINKNYKSNLKKGYVNRTIADGKMRLTPDGDSRLKALSVKPEV